MDAVRRVESGKWELQIAVEVKDYGERIPAITS
jgi:hypothetical protein